MKSITKLYLEKAENELILAEAIQKISTNNPIKKQLEISKEKTFFTGVITHAYYSIFYSAKAYLIEKEIKTKSPNEHIKTYNELKKLTKKGILDKELFKIYTNELIKADQLLKIYKKEKQKRANFTYKKLPNANMNPAKNSLENSNTFFKVIFNLIDNYSH